MRLWEDRAEFEPVGEGVYGLCKVERRGGFAHLDVYFSGSISEELRNLFMNFIDEHLRQQGVDIYEHIEVTCSVCGYNFPEEVVKRRMVEGSTDIGCPTCDRRVEISQGVQQARQRDPELEKKTWALRTLIEDKRREIVQEAKKVFGQSSVVRRGADNVKILHISDLHMSENVDPLAMLQPLVADLTDRARGRQQGGWGFDRLDYLVISGDLTNRATPEEFVKAGVFISGLIEHFQLTAERCIIVPGNHDLSWEEPVYEWNRRRSRDTEELKEGQYVEQPKVLGVRNENCYPLRFKNFSQYFYHPLVQQEYPLSFNDQCIPFLFPDSRLQFLGVEFLLGNR